MNGQVAVMDGAPANDLRALEAQVQQLQAQVDALRTQLPDNRLSMVVFSGDLDRVLAAFVIARARLPAGWRSRCSSPSGG
jgi:hypothetical protein